jgi:four helix bundle protein
VLADTKGMDSERWHSVPIYERTRRLLVRLGPVLARIGCQDKDLASQLRRASASILLNLAEGAGSSRGTRRQRYESALGSARETLAALHVAQAWAYLQTPDEVLLDEADHLVAILVRFVRRAPDATATKPNPAPGRS